MSDEFDKKMARANLEIKLFGTIIGACGAAVLGTAVATVSPEVPIAINVVAGVGGSVIGALGLLMIREGRQKD